LVSKDPLFKEGKESVRRTARCHVTSEKSSKNYIPCLNEPSQAAIQGFPPPASSQVATADFPRGGEKCAGPVFTRQIYARDGGGRAGLSANRCHSITDHRNGLKFNMKMDNDVLLLCYLDKIRLTLTGNFGELWRVYIVKRGYKREPEPATHPQSTTLHSTGNTSVCVKEVGHSNTRGTVRLCSFPLKITAAHSLHFQHLMWTKGYYFKTPTVKRSLISIVHINS
jgi:hypothetical protein